MSFLSLPDAKSMCRGSIWVKVATAAAAAAGRVKAYRYCGISCDFAFITAAIGAEKAPSKSSNSRA